jgi:hypothetical protein
MSNNIECPNCGTSLDVEDVLASKLESKYKKEFESKIAEKDNQVSRELEKLEEEKVALSKAKQDQSKEVKRQLEQQLKEQREKIEQKLKSDFEEENQEQYKAMQKELNEKTDKLKEFNKAKAEIERLKREKEEAAEEANLAAEKRFNEQLKKEKEKLQDKAESKLREEWELRYKEVEKQLEDQKKLTEEMKRKQEKGSQQLQGEVQELAIEDLLEKEYPFDSIEEVSKGVRGADCLQVVINHNQEQCGSIIYESKRTNAFSDKWIEKLKQDQLSSNADIAVIVTETMPKGMSQFGEMNGVWICSFPNVKFLSQVLREMLININTVKLQNDNRGDKKEMLYNYFASNKFKHTITTIIDTYSSMHEQLNTEKRAFQKQWKKREEQINSVQENMLGLFGSIEGIIGNQLSSNDTFELLAGSDSDED